MDLLLLNCQQCLLGTVSWWLLELYIWTNLNELLVNEFLKRLIILLIKVQFSQIPTAVRPDSFSCAVNLLAGMVALIY